MKPKMFEISAAVVAAGAAVFFMTLLDSGTPANSFEDEEDLFVSQDFD